MYKILKRGYYYNDAHKSEDEYLPASYPTCLLYTSDAADD